MTGLEVPVLRTERLALRGWRGDDFEPFARLRGDPEMMRYYPKPLTREEAWQALARTVGHWVLQGFGLWAAELRGPREFVGYVGLNQPEGWPGLEVGWMIDKRHWGKGLAVEGGHVALDYAWNELGADHVISVIHPDNQQSIRVAEKLGETYEREWTNSEGVVHGIWAIDRPTAG